MNIKNNQVIKDASISIYFTASVSKDQERSLFLIQLVLFWNFQMHALIDQTGPLGIQKLLSMDGSKHAIKFVKRICVHKSLPTCHRVDARGALSCRDLVELDNL